MTFITSEMKKGALMILLRRAGRNPIHRSLHLFLLVNFVFLPTIFFGGCSGCPYSFSGASIPPHLKSIAIPVADDRSGSGEPTLRDKLTQKLTQRFLDDNSFRITERNNADAVLECAVSQVTDAPAIITAGESVQVMRVTVVVQVAYKDLVEKKLVFEKSFSDFGDYPSGGSLDQRSRAIETALDKITEDILLNTVSGW